MVKSKKKLREEINKLIIRRIDFRRRRTKLCSDRSNISLKIKECDKELDAIDDLLQEKLDLIHKAK